MTEFLSMRAYAKRRGVSAEAVSKAVKKGRISTVTDPNGDRKIDPVVADREWAANTNPAHPRGQPEPSAASTQPDAPRGGPAVADSIKVLKAYQARLAKMEYEERSGKLHDVDACKKDAFKSARAVRDALMTIPAKLAPEFASETDQFEIHKRLEEELRQALEAISADIEAADP